MLRCALAFVTALVLGGECPAIQPADPAAPTPPPADEVKKEEPRLNAGVLGAFAARSIGPALMSGRIGDFAVDPADHRVIYAAVSSGNVWKSVNAGITWSPIFDSHGSYSIGCVTLDPTNANVVWVGTGENNSQRSVGWGDGVYVSRDAGKSFSNVGLRDSEHIGMIRVDPRNPNVVYVAAQGPLWRSGGERGLYKTTDAGATWERVLHIDDDTGVSEVHMDPRNPDVLYASAYQRRRHVWTLVNGGPGSGVHKSTDAGKTWRKIESGLPGGEKGRIGLALSPANPDVLYAIVEATEGAGGVFRSTDRGESWEKRSSYMTSSPQYYNELFCDPHDPDRLFIMDTFMQMSEDGGATSRSLVASGMHVDSHALWIDPDDTRHLLAGCDGGIYESFDRGANWRFVPNLPVMQFYRVALDYAEPFYNVYGGTQDNNTLGGPSRTLDRIGIANEHWFNTVGGDGFEPAIDPTDPNIVYSQWQHGGLVRFDRLSGIAVDIKPRERDGDPPNVWHWDSPLLISPHDHKRLYFAGRRVFRSDDRGDSWRAVSPELHQGLDRNQLKVFDKVLPPDVPSKHLSTSIFGNIVSLAESPKAEGLIYAGTDDGVIQVTDNAGSTWTKLNSFAGVPENTYVSGLTASMHDANVVFACFDNHKNGDFKPYVLRSDDRGRTWASIAGDLPERATCYSIQQDHASPSLLFVGTEFGAFVTLDAGARWFKVPGLPTIAVRDVEIQRRENDVVFATFGRGFYIIDDYAPLRVLSEELLAQDAALLPVREADAFMYANRLGGGDGKGTQGATFFAAPNPPAGATFTYYLRDKINSRKELRKEDEKDGEFKYPTLDEFRAEDREIEPRTVLVIKDARGELVREVPASRDAGLHRTTWDLRYPNPRSTSGSGDGPMALEGAYSAELCRIVDQQRTTLAGPVNFAVRSAYRGTFAAKGKAAEETFAFQMRGRDLQRGVQAALDLTDRAQERVARAREACGATPGLPTDHRPALEALRTRLTELQVALRGDPTEGRRVVPELPSISERIANSIDETYGSMEPPTQTMREQAEIAARDLAAVIEKYRAIDPEIEMIERALQAAGSPHLPGVVPAKK